MNQYLLLAFCVIASYLIGSILFAIIITKIALGKDIRKMGNTNPGASNVMRNVGTAAGVLTAILDIAKAVIPIIIARLFFFKGDTFFDWIALFLMGMAAILGHCRPFWNKFNKGGGGMGCAIGVMIFFVPFEYGISLILGIIIAYTVMRNAEYKFGRWSVAFAMLLAPFTVLIINQILDIKLFWHISIGGHNIGIVVSSFLLLLEMFILNSYELFHWLKKPKDKTNPDRPYLKDQ